MESSAVHKLHRYSRATYIYIFVRFRCPVELGLCKCNTSFYYVVTQLIRRCLNFKKSFDFSNFFKKNVCLNKKSAPKNLRHFLIFRYNRIHTKWFTAWLTEHSCISHTFWQARKKPKSFLLEKKKNITDTASIVHIKLNKCALIYLC